MGEAIFQLFPQVLPKTHCEFSPLRRAEEGAQREEIFTQYFAFKRRIIICFKLCRKKEKKAIHCAAAAIFIGETKDDRNNLNNMNSYGFKRPSLDIYDNVCQKSHIYGLLNQHQCHRRSLFKGPFNQFKFRPVLCKFRLLLKKITNANVSFSTPIYTVV